MTVTRDIHLMESVLVWLREKTRYAVFDIRGRAWFATHLFRRGDSSVPSPLIPLLCSSQLTSLLRSKRRGGAVGVAGLFGLAPCGADAPRRVCKAATASDRAKHSLCVISV